METNQAECANCKALARRIRELEADNQVLSQRVSDYGWAVNPDRMGGAYSEDERRNAYEWK